LEGERDGCCWPVAPLGRPDCRAPVGHLHGGKAIFDADIAALRPSKLIEPAEEAVRSLPWRETRRTLEASGIPHDDNETFVKERNYLDKSNPEILHDEITVIDHAFTRPWTVDKRSIRQRKVLWLENNCNENNHHVVTGTQNYFVSGDGYLMPARKDQLPPDLRYFKQTGKQRF
jgi:hypothetical protein